MTESEWLTATEPQVMLEGLRSRGNADDRRLRLFGCACVRRVWYLLIDEASRRAVEIAEEYADGQASRMQLDHAKDATWHPWRTSGARTVSRYALRLSRTLAEAACYVGARGVWKAAADATRHVTWVAGTEFYRHVALNGQPELRNQRTLREDAKAAERAAHVALLRCIFGNPFRPPPYISESVRAWNDRTVVRIAEAIYQEKQWDDVAILADALEEAGYEDAGVIEHLRGPGPHFRGCFAVDVILGKG